MGAFDYLDADLRKRVEADIADMKKANDAFESDGGQDKAREGQKANSDKLVATHEEQEKRDKKADKAARKAELQELVDAAVNDKLANLRGASKAALLGDGPKGRDEGGRRKASAQFVKPHPFLKATFRDYQAGELFTALLNSKAIELPSGYFDIEAINAGRKALLEMADYGDTPSASKGNLAHLPPGTKATLGATGATGGYVLPNNLVDTVIKPRTQAAVYSQLVTVINGVAVRGVDMPYRTGAPARMQFQNWGVTKENLNEAYGSYTAVLGTMARVYDISKQYARFSAGSAEQDVLDELVRAAELGEDYYMIAGAGTGSVGTGDPTTGVYTGLIADGTFTTAFTPSATTLAGSMSAAFAKMLGAMGTRARADSVTLVTDAVTFWTLMAQGTDTAGYFLSPTGGPGDISAQGVRTDLRRTDGGGISIWGQDVKYDANFNTNTGTTKGAIAGQWKQAKLYRGMEFRIDTSDTAGTRFDQNLIGFRGEQEIGFNAYPAIAVGAFQWCAAVMA
jgi:HK97 family phage major capsid protein